MHFSEFKFGYYYHLTTKQLFRSDKLNLRYLKFDELDKFIDFWQGESTFKHFLTGREIKAQCNYVIKIDYKSGKDPDYLYTGDLWSSAPDGLKSHDIQVSNAYALITINST